MSEPKIIAKLSLKAMSATPNKGAIEPGKPVILAAIYGVANKSEVITTNFGESTRFTGNFEGLNVATGEVFRSGKAFLPSIVESLLEEAVNSTDDAGIEFAFEIGAEHSEKGNMGYAYTVRPLRKMAESDSLSHLRSEVQTHLKSLPAPEESKAPTSKKK